MHRAGFDWPIQAALLDDEQANIYFSYQTIIA